jgi:phosphatidylglycerol:prolipoprotein diacylglycerol transferase
MAFPYLTDVLHALGLNIPLPVPTFGLLVAIAFFVAKWVAGIEARRLLPALPPDFMSDVCIAGFISGLVGARIFHLLEYPREFLEHPLAMLFSRSGFTIFGGLIIGLSTGGWYARRRGAPLAPLLDAVAPAIFLGYAIGRIGCQISGDGDWGIAVTAAPPGWLPHWLWAQTYDGNIAGVILPPPGVYPTPIYESLMSFAAFGLLWSLRRHHRAPGWLFGVYLLLAGVERLLIELIRVNSRYTLFGMDVTQAQLIASACIVAGVIVMWWRARPASPSQLPNAGPSGPSR